MTTLTPQSVLETLPYISLQPSASLVISDILKPRSTISVEDVWVSCYRTASHETGSVEASQPPAGSVHGKIRISEGVVEGTVEATSRDDKVTVHMHTLSHFTVSCPSLSIPPTSLLLPSSSANTPQTGSSHSTNPSSEEAPAPALLRFPVKGGMSCFTLSGDGKRVAVGGRDGQARVVEIVQYEQGQAGQRKKLGKGKETALRGHVGDLTAVEFFPSNEVLVTASSDMSLRVFSASDGSSPRHLTGHTKRITSLHILRSPTPSGPHKGREILSSSLDGTLRLWDIASGDCKRTWSFEHPVTALDIFSAVEQEEEDPENALEGKFALAAHSDGSVSLLDLSSPSSTPAVVCQTTSASPIECITSHSLLSSATERALAVGSRSGVVSLFIVRPSPPSSSTSTAPLQPTAEWKRTEGGTQIHSLQFSSRPSTCSLPVPPGPSSSPTLSLLIASSDGLPYRASLTLPPSSSNAANPVVEVKIVEEFIGLDCEPATGIQEDGEGRVWVSGGGADGGLRVYERE